MKVKNLLTILIGLLVILVIFLGFVIYNNLPPKEVKERVYTSEEIVEPKDIIPEETEEIPTIEETEETCDILGEATIVIYNFKFYPKDITICPGTIVTWVNNDTSPHKVVAYDRLFYGPRLDPGEKYSFTFTKEGTHAYFDAVFPKSGRGTIIVKEEPLPITGAVIGLDSNIKEKSGMFALLILLFVIMVLGLSHGMYTHYKI